VKQDEEERMETSPSPDPRERRSQVRRPVRVDLCCKSIDFDDWLQWRGESRDLCTQGICLAIERSFQPETILVIELTSPASVRTLLARVRWTARDKTGGWLVGCAFTHVLHEDEVEMLIAESSAEPVVPVQGGGEAGKPEASKPEAEGPPANTMENLRARVGKKTMEIRLPSRRTLHGKRPGLARGPESETERSRPAELRPAPVRPTPPRNEPDTPETRRPPPKQVERSTEAAAKTLPEHSAPRAPDPIYKELFARLGKQLESDNLVEARKTLLALLGRNPGDTESLGLLAHVHDHLDSPDQVGELRCFTGHRSPINCVAFAPDGQRAFAGSGGEYQDGFYTDGEDRTLSIWDTLTCGEIARFKEQNSPVLCVACAPSGSHVVTASRGGNLYYIDTRDISIFRTVINHRQMVFGLAFAPDGRCLLTGSDDGVVRLWDLMGKRLRRYEGHATAITSVAFSPDGRWGLSGSLDGTVRLWDIESGAALRCFEGHGKGVLSVAFAPSGRQVLSGSADATLRLWDVEKGTAIQCFEGHSQGVAGVAFTPDGQRIVSGGTDKTVRCWDVASGAELQCFAGHTGAVKCVAISPAGRRVLSGSADRTVRLWRLPP